MPTFQTKRDYVKILTVGALLGLILGLKFLLLATPILGGLLGAACGALLAFTIFFSAAMKNDKGRISVYVWIYWVVILLLVPTGGSAMAGYFDQIVDSIAVAYVGLHLAAILLFLTVMYSVSKIQDWIGK